MSKLRHLLYNQHFIKKIITSIVLSIPFCLSARAKLNLEISCYDVNYIASIGYSVTIFSEDESEKPLDYFSYVYQSTSVGPELLSQTKVRKQISNNSIRYLGLGFELNVNINPLSTENVYPATLILINDDETENINFYCDLKSKHSVANIFNDIVIR